MTTARDVILAPDWFREWRLRDIGSGSSHEKAYAALLADLLSAPDSVRLELAAMLNPWRPIETAPKTMEKADLQERIDEQAREISELEADQKNMLALLGGDMGLKRLRELEAERDGALGQAKVAADIMRRTIQETTARIRELEASNTNMLALLGGDMGLKHVRELEAERDGLQKWNELRAQDIITLGQKVGELEAALEEPNAVVAEALAERDAIRAMMTDGWKEATIAWACCASIHRGYAKGKDALFTTRQADFVKAEETARATLRALSQPAGGGGE